MISILCVTCQQNNLVMSLLSFIHFSKFLLAFCVCVYVHVCVYIYGMRMCELQLATVNDSSVDPHNYTTSRTTLV